MSKAFLKVKIATLSAEAKIIKQEERWFKRCSKTKVDEFPDQCAEFRQIWLNLMEHRKDSVRPEARASNLAYGYMRGRAYRQLESKCWTKPNWGRVAEILLKFDSALYTSLGNLSRAEKISVMLERLEEWSRVSETTLTPTEFITAVQWEGDQGEEVADPILIPVKMLPKSEPDPLSLAAD